MADQTNRDKRSWNMSRIRSVDTKPELVVRRALHGMGYRFRVHDRKLPGRPDIVLRRHKAVVFVHGCFWHRHEGCRYAYSPKSRKGFWLRKFEQNVMRDRTVAHELTLLGWRQLVVWECETKEPTELEQILTAFLENGADADG